jgi:cysteine-rich repeat protein
MHGGVARCWVLCVLSSCFTPVFSDHPVCGPGGACPVGLQCLREVCVATSCAQAADGDACANAEVGDGLCRGGSCVPQRCGDGVVGYDAAGRPEVCDDGNQVGGDGCSADCQSNETCGNGIVDYLVGETCDDGAPGRSGDGCSSRCTSETLDWRHLVPAVMTPRDHAAMAFDTRRSRMVMFGGTTRAGFADLPLGDTWEYDGANWSRPALRLEPPALASPALAFDAARGVLVLVDPGHGDTWEYSGALWRRSPAPPAAVGAGGVPYDLAYDARRHRVVAFDGDTWDFDGTAWLRVATAHRPAMTSLTAIAFDDDRGRVQLFDGAELWEFDGQDWSPRAAIAAPAGARRLALVFDQARHRLIAVMPSQPAPATYQTTAYELSGTSWTAQSTATSVPGRDAAAVTYDPARRVTVLFGGADPVERLLVYNTTYELDESGWSYRARAAEVAPQGSGLAVVDPDRGTTVWLGGGDTWLLDAASWHLRIGVAPDPACSVGAMAFDSRRSHIVALGACGSVTGASQTWTFDGTAWSPLAIQHVPLPGSDMAMTYDVVRDRMVLFIGARAETWLFDGAAWEQPALPPGSGPGSRLGPEMAFDAARGVTVLFGGSHDTEDGLYSVSDTWEFDGALWRELRPVHEPPPRFRPALGYDAGRHRVVLFGGGPRNPDVGHGAATDLWDYDGVDWRPRTTITTPTATEAAQLIYDPVRSRFVLSGTNDWWTLSYLSEVPTELCIAGVDTDGDGLAGCADPDCAGVCAHCGDHVCNELIERAVCPADCP